MTLAIGDHLVIKRHGEIVKPENEGYHEYEVVEGEDGAGFVNYKEAPNSKYEFKRSCVVKLEVVK